MTTRYSVQVVIEEITEPTTTYTNSKKSIRDIIRVVTSADNKVLGIRRAIAHLEQEVLNA